jgi:ribosomal protein L6P/L9E
MSVDIYKLEDGKVKVEKWFGATKESASIRSCISHMANMIVGTTKVRRTCDRAGRGRAQLLEPAH